MTAALDWFAHHSRSTVFLDVPVSRPSWRGWTSDAKEHRFDAVAIATGSVTVERWEEDAFASVVGQAAVYPLVARGYADRPVFGQLAVGTAMLVRSYPTHGLLRPTALVAPNNAAPNTAPAYRARGYDMVPVPVEGIP